MVNLAPNRLKMLPYNGASSHCISKAHVRSLRASGLRGAVQSILHCQRFTQTEPNTGHPDDGQAEHDDPDLQDAASMGVCFHGPTLALDAPKVLIERNGFAIDGSDERRKAVDSREAEWATSLSRCWPASPGRPDSAAAPELKTVIG